MAILAVLSLPCAGAAQTYRAADLGTLGGHWTYPAALNNYGHVAGAAKTASGVVQPFLWNNLSGMLDLNAVATDGSSATALNDSDEVVGGDSATGHAFLWTAGGGMQDLGTLGGCCSTALGINDVGWVVGVSINGVEQAFFWSVGGGMSALSTANGRYTNTVASAINSLGYVVGTGVVAKTGFDSHALLWTVNGSVADMGTLGGIFAAATGINRTNQVVGYSLTATGDTHPFLWTKAAGMVDLGVLSGYGSCAANGINDNGVVVGVCYALEAGQMPHAFLWTQAGGMQDLNGLVSGLPVTLGNALAINERGQISVWAAGQPSFQPSRGYLLTPQ